MPKRFAKSSNKSCHGRDKISMLRNNNKQVNYIT